MRLVLAAFRDHVSIVDLYVNNWVAIAIDRYICRFTESDSIAVRTVTAAIVLVDIARSTIVYMKIIYDYRRV